MGNKNTKMGSGTIAVIIVIVIIALAAIISNVGSSSSGGTKPNSSAVTTATCYICGKTAYTSVGGYHLCITHYTELLEYYTDTAEDDLVVTAHINTTYVGADYKYCSGSVTNNGSKTYTFVKLKIVFKDKEGNVLDTASTYAVGSEGLAPGEKTTYKVYASGNISKIYSCEATIYDWSTK